MRAIRDTVSGFVRNHYSRMGRVLAVGAIGFFIQTLVFEILGIQLAVVAASTATLIGAECAILSNFFLNDRFSFNDVSAHAAPKWQRLLRFHFVVSGSLLTQWIFVFTAEQFTADPWILRMAYVGGVGVGFILNYTGYLLFVWRKESAAAPVPGEDDLHAR